jgi:hypothetical protein
LFSNHFIGNILGTAGRLSLAKFWCFGGCKSSLDGSGNLLFVPLFESPNPLKAELNSICHLLALLGAHHMLHVSGLRVNP